MSVEDVLNALPVADEGEGGSAEPTIEQGDANVKADENKEPVTPTVPLEALREERERRREVQAQLQVLESRMSQILEAMQQQQQRQAGEVAEEEIPVSYEEDPMGYLRQQIESLNKQISGITKVTAEEKQAAHFNELRNSVASSEQWFAQQHPDYWDSVKFLQQRRVAELEALGYSEQHIAAVLGQDAASLVTLAHKQGKNPAEFAYNLARKLGFSGTQGGTQGNLGAQGGKLPGSATEPPSSLSGLGGTPANEGMPSAQDIAKMSDTDFNRLFKKYFPG